MAQALVVRIHAVPPTGARHLGPSPWLPPLPACLEPVTASYVSIHSPICPRIQAYATEFDDDIKDLQRTDLTPRQRLAAQVRAARRGAALAACLVPVSGECCAACTDRPH